MKQFLRYFVLAELTESKTRKILEVLLASRLFSDCGDGVREAAKAALLAGDILEYKKGEKVDFSCKKLFVILSGVLTVSSNSVVLNVLEKGSITGVTGLFDDGNGAKPGTVIKTAKMAKVLVLSEDAVKKLIAEMPGFAQSYIAFLTDRIRFLNRRMAYYTAVNLSKRLAGYLLDATTEENPVVTVNMSKLAAFLNIGRATLYRTLDGLEKAGAAVKDKNTIRVISRDRLTKI